MILTSSDVSSLARTVKLWEYAEYFFAGLVTIACFGEFVAEFTRWYALGVTNPRDAIVRKKRLGKLSTILLVFALAFELICLVKSNAKSDELVGALDAKASDADEAAQGVVQNAAIALSQSSQAISNAADANSLAGDAKGESETAKSLADDAKARATESGNRVRDVERRTAELSKETDLIGIKASQARAWVLRTRSRDTLGDHFKSGQQLSLQNRPTEVAVQD